MSRNDGLWDLADLAGLTELAEMFAVGRAAVANWAGRYADFPAPLIVLAAGPIYSRREVAAWYAANPAFARRPNYSGTPYLKRRDR